MRGLTKAETKLYLSWFKGFSIGFQEGYQHELSNTGNAWHKKTGFFEKRRLNKAQFFKGYEMGHHEIMNVIDKDWSQIDPDIWREWWKQYWLYHYTYDPENINKEEKSNGRKLKLR